MRYKVIYVVATKDRVVLDFEITNNKPSLIELIPLLKRIKDQMKNVTKKYADEFKNKEDIPVKDLEVYETANKYINKIFVNNLNLLKMGFIPETNNTMEELFSLINDFVNQTRSLKKWRHRLNLD